MDSGMFQSDRLNWVLAIVLALLFVTAGCVSIPESSRSDLRDIPKFSSYSDLVAAFESAGQERSYGWGERMGFPLMAVSSPGMTGEASNGAGAGSPDFSGTNVQVEGVDEADIVKTDGTYIYAVSKNKIVITEAYPIDSAKIVSTIDLNDATPVEMLVQNDRLLVFSNRYGATPWMGEMPAIYPTPPGYFGNESLSIVQLFDISDRENPVLLKTLEFSGNYLASRLISDNAYFVIQSPVYYWALPANSADSNETNSNIIPWMAIDGVSSRIAEPMDIGYLPPMPAEEFVTLASLNLDSQEFEKETIAGSAQSVFASMDNIYLASTAWIPPMTPIPLVNDIQRQVVGDQEKTVINKFGLSNGKIGFVSQATVPGHVLNQFSMDEFLGTFRIATTVGQVWDTQNQSQNNLYVLDANLNRLGTLEGLAPGEKIYSARFMGNRAYLVTFKKVDPLFVIDLSNPASPTVLGKLKIPGYSDYLHPLDETHLIGVGKDTIDPSGELVGNRGFDFAWYRGMKLAIFDVTDVANPVELHKVVIGDRGTDSFALQDHKAFLFDAKKNLLVLPISLHEIPEEQKKPLEEIQRMPQYGQLVFQGAFVFRVTLENGFEERGRITHISPEEELKSGYYYSNDSQVQRSLFIGNVLYTYSQKMLKANDLDSLALLKEIPFPKSEFSDPVVPLYR